MENYIAYIIVEVGEEGEDMLEKRRKKGRR
jgi:hypothetical protein